VQHILRVKTVVNNLIERPQRSWASLHHYFLRLT